ncbi:MAG: rhodanese-like domain-containing protein [Candidatus Moranbacteria bacterium]|nr:rhodanese-like domain-containing protein [Candidatus Moranbacteria bacterium]
MAVEQLSADAFEELIKDKKVRLLDVREKYEYDQGCIKGSELAPSTRFREALEKLKVKKNEKVALYCRTGSRSDFLARQMAHDGYKHIYNLEMGIAEWLDYGKKLVK